MDELTKTGGWGTKCTRMRSEFRGLSAFPGAHGTHGVPHPASGKWGELILIS